MSLLRLIQKNFHGLITKESIKKLPLCLLMLVLLLIPTVLAVFSKQALDDRSDSFSVTLYEQNGTLIASESGLLESAARYSLLDTFYKIQTTKKEIATPPGNPDTDRYILANTDLNGTASTLKCYFSVAGGPNYVIDRTGTAYSIPEAHAKSFLTSAHASVFYDSATLPTLKTIDEETVKPSKVTWNYMNLDRKYITLSNPKLESQLKTFHMTGAIGLQFSQEPDVCVVSVFENNQSIYRGNLQDLAHMAVHSGSELTMRIDATWKQKSETQFYGTIQYNFAVQIQNRSVFRISSDRVFPGEWVLLTGTNVTNPGKIHFSADWCPSPIFYQEGNTVYSFLPIPDQTTATSLRFEISHGASAQTFMIALSPQKNTDTSLSPSAFKNSLFLTGNTLNDYHTQLGLLASEPRHLPYFRGSFADPTTAQFRLAYRHGDTVAMADGSSLRLLGSEFISADGSTKAVSSLNHGIVVQVSKSDALGSFVVVDHGCGLRTWYCHLSRTEVSVGDVVQKGQSVGQSGTDGLATGNGFLLLCSINQTMINPTYILGKEIRY